MKIEQNIGKRIKELRTKHNMSQRELAELSGVNYSQIANIERARNSVSIGTLEKLVKPLGAKIEII